MLRQVDILDYEWSTSVIKKGNKSSHLYLLLLICILKSFLSDLLGFFFLAKADFSKCSVYIVCRSNYYFRAY